jgi:hypothetical protein
LRWDSQIGTSATNWPIVPAPDDKWVWGSRWNWQGRPKYSEKTCAHLHKYHRTWPGLEPGPRVMRTRAEVWHGLICTCPSS